MLLKMTPGSEAAVAGNLANQIKKNHLPGQVLYHLALYPSTALVTTSKFQALSKDVGSSQQNSALGGLLPAGQGCWIKPTELRIGWAAASWLTILPKLTTVVALLHENRCWKEAPQPFVIVRIA